MYLHIYMKRSSAHSFRDEWTRKFSSLWLNLLAGMGGIGPGIFIFRRCVVRHLQYFYSLASWPFPNWNVWGTGSHVVSGTLFVAPILFNVPHSLSPLSWGAAFVRSIFSVPSRFPIHRPRPLRIFQKVFLGDTPPCRLNCVPCSLGFIGCIVSCSQLLVGSSRRITIFFNSEVDSVEIQTSAGFLLEAHLENASYSLWVGVVSTTIRLYYIQQRVTVLSPFVFISSLKGGYNT